MRLIALFGFIVFFSLSSCNTDNDDIIQSSLDSLITNELDSLGFNYTLENGFYRYPILENVVPRQGYSDGRIYTISYELWVYGGDTLGRESSIKVRAGASAVYPLGFDRALPFIEEGETWGFIVPDSLGYGDFSFEPLISSNSYLQFEITVDSIQNNDLQLTEEIAEIQTYINNSPLIDTTVIDVDTLIYLQSGIAYSRLNPGNSIRPVEGQEVTVSYELSLLDSTSVDVRNGLNNFTYILGSGEVFQGFEQSIRQMTEGETALFIVPSGLAYAESARVIPNILEEGRNVYMLDHVLNPMRPVIPTYASKVGPYEVLRLEITLLSVN